MRCKFCGAEIKEGASACEYCGSEAENYKTVSKTVIKDSKKPHSSIVGMICKGAIILACIWAVVVIISFIVVFNSDVFKTYYGYHKNAYTDYKMPQDEKNLTGQIISCDKNGVAMIEYEGHIYEDVVILDKTLIAWLNNTGRKLDAVEICFATDRNGDISELGLLSSGFFIMAKEEGRYLAIRDSHVISFTSETTLVEEGYYIGYFSYPDMLLYSVKEESPFSIVYMDPKCEDKESVVVKEFYTGEEIAVYKILVNDKWYYCSKNTYDTIQIDDMLSEYEMYPNQEPAFIVRD
ncbi:MAG: zinc ribbon domain-containing protein [Ruminococcus flavefaciens]|nr:zinc ribbon domain-containing protein [Ruminococcus flavefaciens]